jgi:hypothetical protein
VGTTAAVAGVGLVTIEVGKACGLAADGEATGIIGSLKGSRAVGAEVDGALSNRAADVIGDTHGQIVSIDEGDIVPVRSTSSTQGPFSDGRGGNTSSGVRVAAQASIALSVKAVEGSLGEVAVTTGPDTTSLPVVGNREGLDGPGGGLPTGLDRRDGRADVQVGKDGGPDGEGARIVDGERPSCDRGGSGEENSGGLHDDR